MSLSRTILNVKKTVNLTILSFILISISREFYVSAVMVMTVAPGHLVELPCPSIDDEHIFMFWQLSDDKNIIGPGNPLDESKYDYEVLTGKLMIRGVSTAESGFYKCVARGIKDASAIKMHMVELVVNKDWIEVENPDYEVNLITILLIIMVVFVGAAIILFIITTKRSKPHIFEDLQESREQSPVTYLPPIIQTPPPGPAAIPQATALDSFGMEVDFPRVFEQMQQTRPLL